MHIASAASMLMGLGALVALQPASAAAEEQFSPLDRDGSRLSVPNQKLSEAIRCVPDPAEGKTWVLLIHGTGADSEINWSWNHLPGLDELGIPWCTVDLPVGGTGDLQLNAEYVVHAIRETYRRSGSRIGIIGHSQGGSSPRWALRFWPDTREMVDDLVGYAPPNHGSASANATCRTDGPCSPSSHQFRTDSRFTAALNSFTETFAGISYTNIYSRTDFIATPNSDDTGTTSLHVGEGEITNVAIQDVCPTQTTEHLGLAYDAVAWALAYDALTHAGPAVADRLAPSVCAELTMPGVNKATFAIEAANAAAAYQASPSAPDVSSEPKLRCYTLPAGCMRLVPTSRRLVIRDGGFGVRVRCTDAEERDCAGRALIRGRGKTLARGEATLNAHTTGVLVLDPTRAGKAALGRRPTSRHEATLELRTDGNVSRSRVRLGPGG